MNKYNVQLLSKTENIIETVITAILTCRHSGDFKYLKENISNTMSDEEKALLIKRVISIGHMSVIEHVSFTFLIENISRSCSHQLVRHRISTISQESQRAVSVESIEPIIPDSIERSESSKELFLSAIAFCNKVYKKLIVNGIPKEDARYILPNATPTKLVFSCNARELYHIFDTRLCLCAENEIRGVVDEIREIVQFMFPTIFPDELIGPECLSKGVCFQNNTKCRRNVELVSCGVATR